MAIGDPGYPSAPPSAYTSTVSSIGLNIPVPERMTLQAEANALLDQIGRAQAILDQFTPQPGTPSQGPVILPLGQALAAGRDQMQRLIERIDSLFQAVGQI